LRRETGYRFSIDTKVCHDKKDGSQSDDFEALQGPDIPQPTEKKQAKSNNPHYVMTTVYLSKQLHRLRANKAKENLEP
jgi:hypothetical protein